MPPLATSLRVLTTRPIASTQTAGLLPLLVPLLHQSSRIASQARHASILGALSDNPGAYSKRIRRGRGPASGKGKTSGRGHKGQKQHGKVPAGFQGGQTPLEVVKGVRGFENQFSLDMTPINLDRIQSWIEQGRIDASRPITVKELQESRCTHGIKDGIKLLARATAPLTHPINITVSRASASAIAAVEAAGGSVQTRYYTRPSIQRILKNQTHPTLSLMSAASTSAPQSTSSTTTIPPTARTPSETEANPFEDASTRSANSSTQSSVSNPPSTSQTQPSTTSIFRTPPSPFPPPSKYRYRLPDATSRKDLEYYRDPAHRGYLSYQVEEGAGPSLFFKTPQQTLAGREKATKRTGGKGKGKGDVRGEGRLF